MAIKGFNVPYLSKNISYLQSSIMISDAKFVSQNSCIVIVVSATKNKVTQNLPTTLKTESMRKE